VYKVPSDPLLIQRSVCLSVPGNIETNCHKTDIFILLVTSFCFTGTFVSNSWESGNLNFGHLTINLIHCALLGRNLSLGVKRLKREANYSTTSRAEVTSMWKCTFPPLPHTPSWRAQRLFEGPSYYDVTKVREICGVGSTLASFYR
jgi:hypothetical protein